MPRQTRPPFVDYQECFDGFTRIRKEMNDLINAEDYSMVKKSFDALKAYAANEETIAMDLLAYYYKSGIENVVPENYQRFIQWEIVAASRGNEFAIEKIQFLIGYACDIIMEHENYDLIEYRNDIDDENVLYVLGKAICKVLVKKLNLFPVDLIELEDNARPYTQEDFVVFRQVLDDALPEIISSLSLLKN